VTTEALLHEAFRTSRAYVDQLERTSLIVAAWLKDDRSAHAKAVSYGKLAAAKQRRDDACNALFDAIVYPAKETTP